ncbi:MAG: PIG-L family deacetylase [Prolixibacteraceae bacterium]|nr:PIG-L family deacetylase [Prolixibacteraceae bacterium]
MPDRAKNPEVEKSKTVALIVAHPDDETLWAGGTVLSHPEWDCFVVCLCRGSDTNRAPKFYKALKMLNAEGTMGDLDDGPEQMPLEEKILEGAILKLLPPQHFDLVITHDPKGEYTRHLRHEETGRSVKNLWGAGKISATELWTFAYEDGNREYYPIPVKSADVSQKLTKDIWQKKYEVITEIYGFATECWEARTTPAAEAFRKFTDPSEIVKRINVKGAVL